MNHTFDFPMIDCCQHIRKFTEALMLISIAQRDNLEVPPQINSLTPEAGLEILIAPLVPSQNFAPGVLRTVPRGSEKFGRWAPDLAPSIISNF